MAEKQPRENTGIVPYRFEPQKQIKDREENDDHIPDTEETSDDGWDGMDVETEGWRLDNVRWCRCTHCTSLPTIKESICCTEMLELNFKMEELSCVINNPEFTTVCLNPAVLRTALIAKSDFRHDDLREPIHNEYV